MTAKAGAEGAAVVDAFDCRPYRTIADIGGGRGHLLQAVLDVASETEGIVFDLPEVIDSLDIEHPRMRATAGDFFKGCSTHRRCLRAHGGSARLAGRGVRGDPGGDPSCGQR